MPSRLSRRTFLQNISAVGLAGHAKLVRADSMQMSAMAEKPQPMLHVLELPPFVDPLPVPVSFARGIGKTKTLRIAMREIHAKVHRDLPPTRMWSYGPATLGPVIEARSGEPLAVEWVNQLPTQHFLPVDHTLHGCGAGIPEVRACTHLHGAKAPPPDDGQPDDWFVSGAHRTCVYPMQQEATALWYHDHAMGINRLNIYAGLFGMLLIRDHTEDSLHLPTGRHEVPLILYDRNFTADGQLFYPTSGIPGKPWVPEFSGDGLLVNGKLRPYFEVEPRLYRFRILNAANSRFFDLTLANKQPLVQIGSDQGLLGAPVDMPRLVLAPGERADLLVDFSKLAGQKVHLRTGAMDILQFRVSGAPAASTSVPRTLRSVPRAPESEATVTRRITLNEFQDYVRNPMVMLINRTRWHEPVTERPKLNSTEIWEFVNETEDTHPMHLHMVRFQILDRRTFEPFEFMMKKQMRYLAPPEPPAANEMGWKDVVQCPPGMVTRIVVKFEGYTGMYLYHCHILEHESNDMMRPFEVIA